MKRYLCALIAGGLLALPLAGCDDAELNEKIVKVQAVTAAVCKFVPTAAAVAGVLTAGNPAVATVSGAATAICEAISSAPSRLYSGDQERKCVAYVEDVCIEGEPVSPTKPDENEAPPS